LVLDLERPELFPKLPGFRALGSVTLATFLLYSPLAPTSRESREP
jgi:hypothetical protein